MCVVELNCFISRIYRYDFFSLTGYMSHRKEAIFALLATTSIGAIWGGPLPYYGGRVKLTYFIIYIRNIEFLINNIPYFQTGFM